MWNNWTDAPVRRDRRSASGSDDEVKLQKELRIYLFISTLQEQKKKKNKCSPQSRKLRGALSLSPRKVRPSVFLHKFALTGHLNSYNVQLLVKSQSNGSNSSYLDITRWWRWLCLSSKWVSKWGERGFKRPWIVATAIRDVTHGLYTSCSLNTIKVSLCHHAHADLIP